MSKFYDNYLNFFLGLTAKSKETIELYVDELIRKGEVAKDDAYKLVSELIERGETERDELRKIIKEEVNKFCSLRNSACANAPITEDLIRKIIREEIHDALKAGHHKHSDK